MTAVNRSAVRGAWSVLAAATALLCLAGTARAQDVEPILPKRWSVKLGAFFPTQGNLKDQASNVWWAAGVDFFPNFRYRPLSADIYFGADFQFRDSGGQTFMQVPLTVKLIWIFTRPDAKYRIYGGGGAGIYFINTAFRGETVQPGAKFILGVDLNQNWFVEGNFDYVGGFTDDTGTGLRTDGFTVYGGYRF